MEKSSKISIIRYIYLYLVTAITIVMIIVSTVGFIRIVLNEYVFDVKGWDEFQSPKQYECSEDVLFYTYNDKGLKVPKDAKLRTEDMTKAEVEECVKTTMETRRAQRLNEVKSEVVTWLSMIIVALPLYLYHWGVIKRENKSKSKK